LQCGYRKYFAFQYPLVHINAENALFGFRETEKAAIIDDRTKY
jgi:hypothetical protein